MLSRCVVHGVALTLECVLPSLRLSLVFDLIFFLLPSPPQAAHYSVRALGNVILALLFVVLMYLEPPPPPTLGAAIIFYQPVKVS